MIAVWVIGSLMLLLIVQHSARQLLQQSAVAESSQASSTPLIDLNSVEVRVRQSGHETLRLRAARLAVFRDLRTITVDNITDGLAYQNGKPALTFSAGQVQFQASYSSMTTGFVRLSHMVNARLLLAPTPIGITADSISWRYPQGMVITNQRVTAKVNGLGTVTCSSIQADPISHSIDFGGVTVLTNLSLLPAQLIDETAPPPAQAGQTSVKTATPDNRVKMSAPEGGRWDQQQNVLTLRGPVTFQQADATMQTVGAVYDRTTDTAKGLSPVKIIDKQDTLTGTNGTVDFQTHIATLDGDVKLNAVSTGAAKGSLESEDKDPAQLRCDHMTYNYRTKLADASGHLIILQTTRTVTADTGHFDANTQIATLNGDVDAKDADGKHLKSQVAHVSVKHGDEWIEVPGPIIAEFPVNDVDSTPTKPTAPTKPAAPPASITPH